ncbi:MAG: SDR family oxidoreductase, partial [Shewanella sp.]
HNHKPQITPMTKLLIVGANGFVGRRLLEKYAGNPAFIVYAISKAKDIRPSDKYHFKQLDLTDLPGLEEYINTIQPDVIINTAALSSPQVCQENALLAKKVNVESVKVMAAYAAENNKFIVHLSTDFVFNGVRKRLYTEDDDRGPQNFYGETKSQAEDVLINSDCRSAIARIEVVFGEHYPGQHGNIFTLVRDTLSSGKTLKVVNDQYRTPTFIDDVVWGVEAIVQRNHTGIFHIAGPDYLSIADFAYRIARYFQLDESLIQPVPSSHINDSVRRPRYSGLSIKKSKKTLGYNPSNIAKALGIIATPKNTQR